MSVPLSVKWISPFRELIIGGFQSLPLTLAGTIGFFAANSTNLAFLYLFAILAIVIPFSVGFTQFIAPKTNEVFAKIFGEPAIWKAITLLIVSGGIVFGGFSASLIPDSIPAIPILFQYLGLLFFFAANEFLGENKSETTLPSKSVCHLVGSSLSNNAPESIAPSYWITSVSFLIMYFFRNALDNYNQPIDPAVDPQKITRRKIQTIFAMIFILLIGLIALGLRVFYTGCETMVSTVSSLTLAFMLLMPIYQVANLSGLDLFGMFQNITLGCDTNSYKCVLKTKD